MEPAIAAGGLWCRKGHEGCPELWAHHLELKTVQEKVPEVPLCPGFCTESAAVDSPVYTVKGT